MNNQLVTLHGRKATTTSLKVAEVFGKRHDNVMRDIKQILSDCAALKIEDRSRLNFQPSEYTDTTGRKLPMYEMNRAGFSLLAMGFTGKKALEWKVKYIVAFDLMEQALLNQQNLSWQEARTNNKIGRREETDAILQFVEYATKQGSKNARKYFINLTSMTYRALFLVYEASPKPFRDLLDVAQMSFLTTAEYLVQAALDEGMKQGLLYKDIYQMARDRVTGYAVQLPKNRLEVKPAQSLLFS